MTACLCSFDNACKYSGGRTDEREIEVTSVAQLGSSFFCYEIPGSSYICNSGIA